MKRGNTDCRRFQKRRDWIRQRLNTVKSTFFDAAIGSKNYARQQYLCNGLGTADQPLHHEQQWVWQKASFYNEQFGTPIMCDMFREALLLYSKSLLNNIFVYNFHYIYFPKTIPSKIYYHCIAALYINTAVSFKSSITKIYYCWPPIFDPI